MVSPGLIFVQKAVLQGLFSRELISGGAYHWKPRILRFKMGWASPQKQPKTLLKQAGGGGGGGAYYRRGLPLEAEDFAIQNGLGFTTKTA